MSTNASQTVAAGQLRSFVERIERLEAEIKDLNTDKSEVYKELRGVGFDVKAVRQCVAARKLDSSDLAERNAVFDLYWEALTGASRVHVHEDNANSEIGSRAETHNSHHVGRASGAQRQGAVAAQAPDTNPQPTSSPEADTAETVSPPTVSAPIPDDIPAFLLKDRPPVVLRPHCLNPELCAGSGREHCYACKKALAESEAA